MTANVELLDPTKIIPNPDNPRLIFRVQELEELEQSISAQGILVPLTIYKDGHQYVILDGERRWRCARKLGLHRVPVIIQPKPERMQNIMMMFAIHNARRDWDPLPTALKLQELERELSRTRDKKLTEAELAAAASLSRGAVRRYRKILKIPRDLQKLLLKDLNDPSRESALSVDQVIEAVDAADRLMERGILEGAEERELIDAIVHKFRNGTIRNTVEPRKLTAVARFVRKGELSPNRARTAIRRFIAREDMTISQVVSQTIESAEQHKALERTYRNFEERWIARLESDAALAVEMRPKIRDLIARLRALI